MHYRHISRQSRRRSVLFRAPGLLILALAFGASGVMTVADLFAARTELSFSGWSCDIKGNISIDTGERIFHLPGQEYYSRTKIRPQYGERWFCSEAEARAAGWRKAYR